MLEEDDLGVYFEAVELTPDGAEPNGRWAPVVRGRRERRATRGVPKGRGVKAREKRRIEGRAIVVLSCSKMLETGECDNTVRRCKRRLLIHHSGKLGSVFSPSLSWGAFPRTMLHTQSYHKSQLVYNPNSSPKPLNPSLFPLAIPIQPLHALYNLFTLPVQLIQTRHFLQIILFIKHPPEECKAIGLVFVQYLDNKFR